MIGCFVDRCLYFSRFLLTIVLSVFLRFTDSDYHFGIFKFLEQTRTGLLFALIFCWNKYGFFLVDVTKYPYFKLPWFFQLRIDFVFAS